MIVVVLLLQRSIDTWRVLSDIEYYKLSWLVEEIQILYSNEVNISKKRRFIVYSCTIPTVSNTNSAALL